MLSLTSVRIPKLICAPRAPPSPLPRHGRTTAAALNRLCSHAVCFYRTRTC
uniref:Uncharacterized protein n=1 Tax=Helianthus annuus TaxID=4232 RepID=A0A251UAM8_HELAN